MLERIDVLREEIDIVVSHSQAVQMAAARQEQAAAEEAVLQLQVQLREQEVKAAQFSGIFATYQTKVTDLARLEELHRERQARIVEVDVMDIEKYPQVVVIDRPADIAERIGPDYGQLAALVFGASLVGAILVVWLYGFLAPRPEQPAYVTLSGVHMYPADVEAALAHRQSARPQLQSTDTPLLDADQPAQPSGTDTDPPDR